MVVVPLLLLSSPGHVLSRKVIADGRRGTASLRAEHRVAARRSSTPWTSVVTMTYRMVRTDAAASDNATTTTTAPAIEPVRYDAPTSTTTTTTDPPPPAPPPTTTTTVARPAPASSSAQNEETGEASWYQAPAGTCASLNIPLGTTVTVTDLSNGLSTTCTVNDRGPYVQGRIIDLSEQTFSQLADPSSGVIDVRVTW